jgi:hypothetical protein
MDVMARIETPEGQGKGYHGTGKLGKAGRGCT